MGIEEGASGGNGQVIKHKGHKLPDGTTGRPHYQTEGRDGHTFWLIPIGTAAMEFLFSPDALAADEDIDTNNNGIADMLEADEKSKSKSECNHECK